MQHVHRLQRLFDLYHILEKSSQLLESTRIAGAIDHQLTLSVTPPAEAPMATTSGQCARES